MGEEFEWEEFADMAIEELNEFLHVESCFVKEEHEFLSKLYSMEQIIIHLDERISEKLIHLHDLNKRISEKFLEIRDLIESGELCELTILKEENHILSKIKEDMKHRDWRVVKKDIELETKDELKVLRLEEKEIKNLHSKFLDLMKIMKRRNLVSALNEDLILQKDKEQYVKLEEYYFVQIYKFIGNYERIFRHLWGKELLLSRKIMDDSKKI
jgi:hypothetical protein